MNSIETIQQNRIFKEFDSSNKTAKRNTFYVVVLTFVTMIAEIFAGYYYNSMALLADGWHMSSHTFALGLAYLTYVMASKNVGNFKFNFGTYKIEVLGGFASAILLLVVAFFMIFYSFDRLLNPVTIFYKEAIIVTIVGLIINIISAFMLRGKPHSHGPTNECNVSKSKKNGELDHKNDMNLKAAYVHVLTDALTSVAALIALIGGLLWGFNWLDALMGIIGSIIVTIWAIGILKQSGKILVDAEMDHEIVQKVIDTINNMGKSINIIDLRISRVGKNNFSCVVSLSLQEKLSQNDIKKALLEHKELAFISIEIV